jgi:hypothetical protein
MAVVTEKFVTGDKAAVTNGELKVTFETPGDFADWLEDHYGENLADWQWCRP